MGRYGGKETADFVNRPVFYKLENTTFRKKTKFTQSYVFLFLEYRTMDKV
jgi:hypothetical protein